MCFKKNAKYVFQQQSPVGLAASVIVTIINIVVAAVVSGGGGGDGGVYVCCHDVLVEIIGQLLVLCFPYHKLWESKELAPLGFYNKELHCLASFFVHTKEIYSDRILRAGSPDQGIGRSISPGSFI